MKLSTLGKIILSTGAAILLSGCVVMREKGDINLPQYLSSKPSIYLTVSYTQFKNRERWAFMNETSRKGVLKDAIKLLNQTGLFGEIHTDKTKTDLKIHHIIV